VAALFSNLNLVKKHKIAYNLATSEAGEKIAQILNKILKNINLIKFRDNAILLNKISHQFLVTI
jgi:hypothetical protein